MIVILFIFDISFRFVILMIILFECFIFKDNIPNSIQLINDMGDPFQTVMVQKF